METVIFFTVQSICDLAFAGIQVEDFLVAQRAKRVKTVKEASVVLVTERRSAFITTGLHFNKEVWLVTWKNGIFKIEVL